MRKTSVRNFITKGYYISMETYSLIDTNGTTMSEYCDLVKLAELLNPKTDADSRSEDKIEDETIQDVSHVSNNNDVNRSENDDKERKEITDPEEASYLFENESAETADWRKSPQWDVSYRQQVTTSDVFLQMGGKTPATASCEDMVIQVYLPGESRQNIDLKITNQRLDLMSPQFRLNIPLPHPVDPQRGNAQWDSDLSKLVVTLRMAREFDYINF